MPEERFIKLVSDTAFKYIFKNEDTRFFYKRIIKELIDINIEEYELYDNELNSGNNKMDYRLDILLVNKKNKHKRINIEMNAKYYKELVERNDLHLYHQAGYEYDKGEKFKNFEIIQINLNDYYHPKDKRIDYSLYEMTDVDNKLKKENIKIHEIYLPKVKEVCYDEVKNYIGVLTSKSFKEMEKYVGKTKELKKIMDEVKRLSEDEEVYRQYDYENVARKLNNSIAENKYNEGIKEGKLEDAKAMLKDNVDIDLIAKYTKLTK